MRTLNQKLEDKAYELGFVRIGFTSTAPFPEYQQELLSRSGYDFWKNNRPDLYRAYDPLAVAPEAKSIISLVLDYGRLDFPSNLDGIVGRTYQSRTYGAPLESISGQRTRLFKDYLHDLGIRTFDAKNLMQLPDRAVGARAGVTTYGKNNFAYADEYGSFIILISILTDAELDTHDLVPTRPCPEGCNRCIKACPTQAMDSEGRLDPRRCVLYNNIFPTPLLDTDLRPKLGLKIHGCDICQLVCPRNTEALEASRVPDLELARISKRFDLEKLLFLDEDYYESTVRPIMYNYIRDLSLFRRNAAIAMGNSGDVTFIAPLDHALTTEENDSVREAILWAIERLKTIEQEN